MFFSSILILTQVWDYSVIRAGFAVDVFLPACRAIAENTANAACNRASYRCLNAATSSGVHSANPAPLFMPVRPRFIGLLGPRHRAQRLIEEAEQKAKEKAEREEERQARARRKYAKKRQK